MNPNRPNILLYNKVRSLLRNNDYDVKMIQNKLITSIHENPEKSLNLSNGRLRYIIDVRIKPTSLDKNLILGSKKHYALNVPKSDVL